MTRPDNLGQCAGRDSMARVDNQRRKQHTGLDPWNLDGGPIFVDLQGPQDAEPHAHEYSYLSTHGLLVG